MDNNVDESRFVDNIKINVVSLPDNKNNVQLQLNIANVLVRLKSFNEEIERCRNDIGITEILGYPLFGSNSDYEKFLQVHFNKFDKDVFEQRINFICFLYRLSKAWRLSIGLALLTHTLPVPIENELFEIKVLGRPGDAQVALVFNHHASNHAIRTWVKSHVDEIEKALRDVNCPRLSEESREAETITLGHQVWLLKHDREDSISYKKRSLIILANTMIKYLVR